jgi:hypothetical protein
MEKLVSPEKIFMKFYISVFLENLSRKFKFDYTLTTIMFTLHKDWCAFMITSCSILLIMRNVWDKRCRKNQNTHFMFNNFFRKSYHLWGNVERYATTWQATDDNKVRRMRIACWLNKATGTHSDYVIVIAFARQQWLHEHASILTYVCPYICVPCLRLPRSKL